MNEELEIRLSIHRSTAHEPGSTAHMRAAPPPATSSRCCCWWDSSARRLSVAGQEARGRTHRPRKRLRSHRRTEAAPDGDAPAPIEPVDGTPTLEAAATYEPKDNVLQIDISEYAGYGGLIVANGGLEPNPDSFFAKEYGFKVKISMSEDETWSPLNNGRLAATATTTDALAVLGRQFDAVVPVQIGYSRGADMVVVDRGIASVNNLAGKVLAASQFNESEFFIRYLAQEAGVPVTVLRDLDAQPAGRTARPGVLRRRLRRLRCLCARTGRGPRRD